MNQVFIRRSVERVSMTREELRQLRPILALIIGGAVGGAAIAALIALAGRVTFWLDATRDNYVALTAIAVVGVVTMVLQVLRRVRPLPERRAQVPHRWLDSRRDWLTAGAFGFMLGGGAFTYLQHATMYALALLMLSAPHMSSAVILGAVYGGNRGATVLYTWIVRHLRLTDRIGLGRSTPILLTLASLALPIWVLSHFTG